MRAPKRQPLRGGCQPVQERHDEELGGLELVVIWGSVALFHARTKSHPKNALREGHSRNCLCDVRRGHLANHGQVEGPDRRSRCFEVSRTFLLNSSRSARERYLQMALPALSSDGTRVSTRQSRRLRARLPSIPEPSALAVETRDRSVRKPLAGNSAGKRPAAVISIASLVSKSS